MELKSRELLELELTLVRDQRKTNRLGWVHTETIRGAEEALTWILAGRFSPAPLTDKHRDATDVQDVRRESEAAAAVSQGFGSGPELSGKATSGNVSQYARGVAETLGWACGALEYEAMGRNDEDIQDEASLID